MFTLINDKIFKLSSSVIYHVVVMLQELWEADLSSQLGKNVNHKFTLVCKYLRVLDRLIYCDINNLLNVDFPDMNRGLVQEYFQILRLYFITENLDKQLNKDTGLVKLQMKFSGKDELQLN